MHAQMSLTHDVLCGTLLVCNHKYVLLIGATLSDNIWIYDIEKYTFIKSNMKCPYNGGMFRGIIVNNYHKTAFIKWIFP